MVVRVPAIHVRNVPEETIAALRERAARHGWSMQRELLEILRTAAGEPANGAASTPIPLVMTETSVTTRWSREEIYGDDGR